MNTIKELSSVSDFRPKRGDKLKLYHLSNEEGMSRKALQAEFDKNNSSSFRTVFKRLKDDLLKGVLTHNFPSLSEEKKDKFKIWKKHLQSKMLINAHKRKVGVKMAIETISLAEKSGELEVVKSLCKELIKHYSTIAPDTTQYRKYFDRLSTVNEKLFYENKVELLYRDLVLCHQRKWSFIHLEISINELIVEGPKVDFYKYRYYYYSVIGLYFQLTNQLDSFIENAKNATIFFDNNAVESSYASKHKFISELVPYYINIGDSANASKRIIQSIKLAPTGVPNWHYSLLNKAIFGFYFKDLGITKDAYQEAELNTKKLNAPIIMERWYLIKGYLSFFSKTGNIEFEKIKIRKYINGIDDRQKDIPQKITVLILKLIHLLADGNKKSYMAECEQLESFINRNLRKHIYVRTKHFLRLLKCVEKGDYNKVRVAAHAKKYIIALKNATPVQTALRFDFELCPYEILWESILNSLNR